MVIENYNSLCYFIIKQIFQCGYWLRLVKYIHRYCVPSYLALLGNFPVKVWISALTGLNPCSLLSWRCWPENLERNLHKYIQNIHNDVPGKRGTEERKLTKINDKDYRGSENWSFVPNSRPDEWDDQRWNIGTNCSS